MVERFKIERIGTHQIEATVLMWRRSRDHVQPLLEERLGYSPGDDLNFFSNILMKECDVWLAIQDAHPLALLAIDNDSIEQLYVEPTEQGAGVGSALLQFAKSISPKRIVLHTHVSNSRAREFYENRGFAIVRFGISPAPESEPDIRYQWLG